MGDSNNHDADAGKPKKGLQRFESQDGDSLQSLRGSYDRALKIHYIVWDDVEATFPDIDYLLVPSSSCFFLIDNNCQLYVAPIDFRGVRFNVT